MFRPGSQLENDRIELAVDSRVGTEFVVAYRRLARGIAMRGDQGLRMRECVS